VSAPLILLMLILPARALLMEVTLL
jgi:hypothetical protein